MRDQPGFFCRTSKWQTLLWFEFCYIDFSKKLVIFFFSRLAINLQWRTSATMTVQDTWPASVCHRTLHPPVATFWSTVGLVLRCFSILRKDSFPCRCLIGPPLSWSFSSSFYSSSLFQSKVEKNCMPQFLMSRRFPRDSKFESDWKFQFKRDDFRYWISQKSMLFFSFGRG